MFKKIYIGGKITGLPIDEYRNKFELAKKRVQKEFPNAEVIIPTELCPDDMSWSDSMEICIDTLWNCDAVCFTPDWKDSHGSLIERKIAEKLGLCIMYITPNNHIINK